MATGGLSGQFKSLSLASNHKIIVGVDYGTTFTGVSYASSDAKGIEDIKFITTWPGPARHADTVFKTPSRIAYRAENQRIGDRRWGFGVEPGMTAYSWTKLLLDQHTPRTQYDDTTLEDASGTGILRLPNGKDAMEVTSDFLSELYRHILKTITKQFTQEALRITPLEFWFTVPAIWSDKAKDATREAARLAGFGNSPSRSHDRVFLITEPEAAAIAALKRTTNDSLEASVKPGDGVLVCDCGGGTVDITTYLVNQTHPTLTFEELCTGIGGKCGSTAVDRNFYSLMSERFGDAFDALPLKRKGPGSALMKKFEIIKSDFGHSTEHMTHELPLNIPLSEPQPEHYDEEEGVILICDDDLRAMFDPVIAQIISLVRQQIADAELELGGGAVNRIILVGGFGDSEYLRKALEKSFGSDGMVMITVPDKPQAAIVQGATLRGLQGLRSTTKRCRRHYGIATSKRFRDGIDDEVNAFIDEFNNLKYVQGVMKWMIAKGEKYPEDYFHTVRLERTHFVGDELKQYMNLYSCDLTKAPERIEHHDVQRVGRIDMDFTNEDLSCFKTKVISGRLYYLLKFSIKVILGAQDGVLKFETISQGRVIGNTSIRYGTIRTL